MHCAASGKERGFHSTTRPGQVVTSLNHLLVLVLDLLGAFYNIMMITHGTIIVLLLVLLYSVVLRVQCTRTGEVADRLAVGVLVFRRIVDVPSVVEEEVITFGPCVRVQCVKGPSAESDIMGQGLFISSVYTRSFNSTYFGSYFGSISFSGTALAHCTRLRCALHATPVVAAVVVVAALRARLQQHNTGKHSPRFKNDCCCAGSGRTQRTSFFVCLRVLADLCRL